MARERNAETATDPPPVSREVPRTAVPAKLAEIIRALDEALLEVYGPHAAFAYHVWGGEGLIAASNATFGFVPPVVATRTGTEPGGNGGPGNREVRDAK